MTPNLPKAVDGKYLDQATVQLNVRIPLRLSLELDKYLTYLDRPLRERLKASNRWPASKQAVVSQALKEFLENHPLRDRPGPDPDPKPIPIKAKPKQPNPNTTNSNLERR